MKCLLITGLGRSGSTLSRQILNAHKGVFVSDESNHFIQAAFLHSSRNRNFLMGMTDAQYAAHLGRYLLSAYAHDSNGKLYFGDKSPPAFVYLDVIRQFLDALDIELKIVWTVRHPFDQAISWLERFRGLALQELGVYNVSLPTMGASVDIILETFFNVWIKQQKVMQSHLGFTLVYEDMVQNTVDVMQACHSNLELEFSENQIQQAFKSRVIGGDPKFMQTKKIHQASTKRYLSVEPVLRQALNKAAEKCQLQKWLTSYPYQLS